MFLGESYIQIDKGIQEDLNKEEKEKKKECRESRAEPIQRGKVIFVISIVKGRVKKGLTERKKKEKKVERLREVEK